MRSKLGVIVTVIMTLIMTMAVVRMIDRDQDNTKYGQYQLPGGKIYREVLLPISFALLVRPG